MAGCTNHQAVGNFQMKGKSEILGRIVGSLVFLSSGF